MNYKQILSILNNEKQLSSEEIGSIKKHFHFTKSRKKLEKISKLLNA